MPNLNNVKVLCSSETMIKDGKSLKVDYRYDKLNRLEKMSVFQVIDNKTFYLGCTEFEYPDTDKNDPNYEAFKDYWVHRVKKDKEGNVIEESYREYNVVPKI